MGLCGTSYMIEQKAHNLSITNDTCTSNTFDIQNKSDISQINNNENEKIKKNKNKKKDIIFKAMIGEKEFPIFIDKKKKIEINIGKSAWSFIPDEELTDFKGHKNYQYNNLNIGCLLIRISNSKNYINIKDNKFQFTANESGSLIISSNLDPNNYQIYKPRGSINISISGGNPYSSYNTIDELTGYKSINYANIKNDTCFSLRHQEISRYINKARSNIKKYYNDFILDYNDNFIMDINDYELPLCEIDINLFDVAEEHCKDLCQNATSGHTGTDGSCIKTRLIKNKINIKEYGESIIYGLINPILIVNSLIIDKYSKNKQNRKNLLNKNYSKIGISLNKHFSYKYCCVIVFGQ